jgi:glyoxylase-like metal-dependent hydrolase (beta-lactamase superfamily II)
MRIMPEILESDGITMKPVYTPGHSKDHLAYFEPDFGRLFSGDIYLADRIRYFRSDERIGDQIDSLKKILELNFDTLLCGHNPHLKNGKKRIAAKLQFLEDFYGHVVTCITEGMTEERDIFKKMGLKEEYFIKWFCFGNISMLNMVRSAVSAFSESRI